MSLCRLLLIVICTLACFQGHAQQDSLLRNSADTSLQRSVKTEHHVSEEKADTIIDLVKPIPLQPFNKIQTTVSRYGKTDSVILKRDTLIGSVKDLSHLAKQKIKEQDQVIKTGIKGQLSDTNNIIRSKYKKLKTGLNNQQAELKDLPRNMALNAGSAIKEKLKGPVYILPHFSSPLLNINSGRIDYNFYYRSNIDTPFIEQNVYQHQLNASMRLTVGKVLPMMLNTQIRRSNSLLFRDITDVQLQFDVSSFQQGLYGNVLSGLNRSADLFKDSLTGKLSELKSFELDKENLAFNSKFTTQQYVEANELLNVPQLSWDKTLPDSLAKIKSDSLRNDALAYLKDYNEAKAMLNKTKQAADSLKQVYDRSLAEVKKIKDLAKGKISNYSQYEELKNNPGIRSKGLDMLPAKYKWLLGIRKFSLGRTPVNYSELTARNISLNGVNFEYNSWYYFSLSAGLVDFRFRDFVINNSKRPKQYFYMGRLGLGNIDRSYIIFSVFKGKKQVFASGSINAPYTFNATGATLEAKYKINRNIFLKGEVAESLAPDFRTNPAKYNKWNLNDKNDKAYALSSAMNFPKTHSRLEGMYKYTGANYQSFSSFQTNSSFVAWSVKADQFLFKKMIRLTAAIKKNEFSNPYLTQTYQSNSVFKSAQLYFRKRGWPVISAGYMPLSQLTNINGIIYENRFNSLNGTISHFYKVGDTKAGTTLMYTKFYNTSADTGFIYFNAQNIFFSHIFQFALYSTTTNITYSTNKNYQYDIIEQDIKIPLKKILVLSAGIKLSSLNQRFVATGGNCSFQISIKQNTLTFFYENGYLPGVHGTLVRNIIGNVQLSKRF